MDKYQVVCEHDPLRFVLALQEMLQAIARSATPALKAVHLNFKLADAEPVIEALLITAHAHEAGAVRVPIH